MQQQKLFDKFPYLESNELILKQVEPQDAELLFEILGNPNCFKYTPRNAWKTLEAVKNVLGHYVRDFIKRKTIYIGIYYRKENDRLVGIAEIFEYDKKTNQAEIGYRINENYWSKGIASHAVKLLLEFLFNEIGLNAVIAGHMTENTKSKNVLLNNGFIHQGTIQKEWTGKGIVNLEMYSRIGRSLCAGQTEK